MTIYYLHNGQEVELIEHLSDGRYLVLELLEEPYDEGGQIPGNTIIVDKVYTEPPTKKFYQKIVELSAQIEELEIKRQIVAQDISMRAIEGQILVEKYAKFTALAKLNDFIDGKITHYLIAGSDLRIIEFKEAVGDSRYDNYSRLLSLFGKSGKDLQWRINQYSDGSGHWSDVVPCTSYEEALQYAQEHINERTKTDTYKSSWLVDFAVKHKLTIDPAYVEAVKEKERQQKRTYLKNAEEALARCKKELEALK